MNGHALRLVVLNLTARDQVKGKRMKIRRILAGVAVAALTFAGAVAAAGPASASCTGSPGCSSGWYGTCYHDPGGYDKNMCPNLAVSWFPDNHRRVYWSGHVYDFVANCCNQGFDEVRIYYRVPGGPWVMLGDGSAPAYGDYAYSDYSISNPGSAHDFIASMRWAGVWVNSPIIRN